MQRNSSSSYIGSVAITLVAWDGLVQLASYIGSFSFCCS